MKPKVLIADEEVMLCEAIAYILSGAGFETFKVGNAEQLLALARETSPQLVLLSETLPCCANPQSAAPGACLSRLRPCCELRENVTGTARGSILMWGTSSHARHRIAALQCGADDYIVKPFGMRELVARAHGLLRRTGALILSEVEKLRSGALLLDAATRQVWLDEPDGAREIKLTSKEFDLLHFLMAHQGEIVTRAALLERVWNRPDAECEAGRTLINVHIGNLRRKLDDDVENPRFIVSLLRRGFMLKNQS